jgi:hypothetical protein
MQQQKADSTQDKDTGQEDRLPDAHTEWLQHEKCERRQRCSRAGACRRREQQQTSAWWGSRMSRKLERGSERRAAAFGGPGSGGAIEA